MHLYIITAQALKHLYSGANQGRFDEQWLIEIKHTMIGPQPITISLLYRSPSPHAGILKSMLCIFKPLNVKWCHFTVWKEKCFVNFCFNLKLKLFNILMEFVQKFYFSWELKQVVRWRVCVHWLKVNPSANLRFPKGCIPVAISVHYSDRLKMCSMHSYGVVYTWC